MTKFNLSSALLCVSGRADSQSRCDCDGGQCVGRGCKEGGKVRETEGTPNGVTPAAGRQLARLGPRNVGNGAKVAGCYATGIRQHHWHQFHGLRDKRIATGRAWGGGGCHRTARVRTAGWSDVEICMLWSLYGQHGRMAILVSRGMEVNLTGEDHGGEGMGHSVDKTRYLQRNEHFPAPS
jgi:hypothetical protein